MLEDSEWVLRGDGKNVKALYRVDRACFAINWMKRRSLLSERVKSCLLHNFIRKNYPEGLINADLY